MTRARARQGFAVVAMASVATLVASSGCSAGASPGHGSRTGGDPGAAISTQALTARAANPMRASRRTAGVHRYEYVFPEGGMYVYDLDHRFKLVQHVSLPDARGVRGVVAAVRTHTLYVSFGSDGGSSEGGSLLAYDLLSGKVLWTRTYSTGVDSMAITPDGSRIYMPTGELAASGVWDLLDAMNGAPIAKIAAGAGAHDTVMGPSGRNVYLGGRDYDYLEVASTSTNRIVRRIGPLRGGVRPFTINGRESLAYTTATGFLGFQVSSIRTGRVLYTEGIPGFSWSPASFAPSAPSHGISLSPDERRVWVLDAPNSYAHSFDVSHVPRRPPRLVASVRLRHQMTGDKSPCAYDCERDGWLQSSRDGRYLFVGDSGDVIGTRSASVVGFLPAMHESRVMLEIDWRRGVPVATTSRQGLGYVR